MHSSCYSRRMMFSASIQKMRNRFHLSGHTMQASCLWANITIPIASMSLLKKAPASPALPFAAWMSMTWERRLSLDLKDRMPLLQKISTNM